MNAVNQYENGGTKTLVSCFFSQCQLQKYFDVFDASKIYIYSPIKWFT